jgi:trk system potassium uptake protein TrkA
MTEKIETKQISKEMNQFVVIGLGRFGKTVALTLANLGKEVLAIDTDSQTIKQIEPQVSGAVVADSTKNDVLYSLGVQNFDCVINCIGDDLEASILTTLICKDLGVKYVVAKAQNEQHKKVLEKIGADMVIFPEIYMGKKLANMLVNPSKNDIVNLTDNFKIVEIATPDFWLDKSILDLNIRKKYKVSIIFVKRDNEVIYPEPETVLLKGDTLLIAGEISKLDNLSNKVNEVLDTSESLKDVMMSE